MLISPVWNKILKIWDTRFELIQIEVKCSKNYLTIFLPQEAGVFRNRKEKKHRKETPKATPKIEKNCMLYIYR